MTLAEDLAAWIADRHAWQRDVVGRFCRNEPVTKDDVTSIADHLIAGSYPDVPAVTAEDIPGPTASGEPVRLLAIAEVEGVNALIPEQRLTFGESGVTIIYGDNATGKSGYARVIREAVNARVKADLLDDVFADESQSQRAVVEYAVGDSDDIQKWSLGRATSQELATVRFYDEDCGDAYVTDASEISYRPSALTLLDRLTRVCDAVQAVLSERLAANLRDRPNLPLVAEGTEAASQLNGLNAGTTAAEITAMTSLPDGHAELLASKLAEEARLKGSDPSKEKDRLSRLASNWEVVATHINRLAGALSAEALAYLTERRQRAIALREAARVASSQNFSEEPLPGVGTETWRVLWEAARDYSEVEAYHQHDFPVVGDGAICVLCQQPLSDGAGERLSRFQTFMTDTTERDAAAAEVDLRSRHTSIATLTTLPAHVMTALSRLQAGEEDPTPLETWINDAVRTATAVVEWVDGDRPTVPAATPPSPAADIGARATSLRSASDQIDAATFKAKLAEVSAEVQQMQARGALAAAEASVCAEVTRLADRARIEEAKRLTDTTGITRKASDLTKDHVTSLVRDAFTRETERLKLERVTLDPTAGRKAVTLEHRPKLLGAVRTTAIEEVLSEGEQTALGLAGFLTEAAFDSAKSAVVLDDPVSSLDSGRRSRVAARLVELAKERQVIVFTHEVTFVNALHKVARDKGVAVSDRAILRDGHKPGKTIDEHPWNVKDTAKRINDLDAELARLRKDRDSLDSEEYCDRAQQWGGRLSQAWERAVNLDVVSEVVDRGTGEVRPKKFRIIARVTEQDDADFQAGYAKTSEWAPRHDQAPETNFVPPEPDEMEAELTRFRNWFGRVKKYRSE